MKSPTALRFSLLSAVFVLAACGTTRSSTTTVSESPAKMDIAEGHHGATALLESRSNSTTTGKAMFTQLGHTVTLKLEVAGATPGEHGAHIHLKGDCSAADASSAGGHWNPATLTHGPADPQHHLGDLGNIIIDQDGKGSLMVSKDYWTLGDGSAQDVVGKALIIHGGTDDLKTDPAGNSGARVACGVITEKK